MNEEPCQKHNTEETFDEEEWSNAMAQIETENQFMAVTDDPAEQM